MSKITSDLGYKKVDYLPVFPVLLSSSAFSSSLSYSLLLLEIHSDLDSE